MQSPPTGQFHGGAIDVSPSTGGTATVKLSRVIVKDSEAWTSDNSVQGHGGGIYCSWVNLTINDSAIFNNRGYQGGGLSFAGNCTATINRSAIYNNTAGLNGGGIRISASTASATINNSTIYGNSSGTAAHYGGGIFISQGATARLNHVTITGNTPQGSAANSGGGIASRHANNKVHIRNSIIYGNSKGDCDKTANLLTNTGNIFGSLNNCGAGTGGVTVTSTPLAASPTTPSSATDPPPYYALPSGSPAINAVTCLPASVGGDEDQRGETRPLPSGGNCDIGAYEFPSTATTTTTTTTEEESGDTPPPPSNEQAPPPGDEPDGDSDSNPAAPPPVSTCLTLDGIAAYNLSESTQCQRVDAMQIANPNIKAGDFADAVDVWSWVTPNTQICFEASGGAFKFIDTAAMPRTLHDLAACSLNGTTCATINGPGILVLLPGEATEACAGFAPAPAPAQAAPRSLSGCMVTLTAALRFRESPGGSLVIRDWIPDSLLPKDVKLTAVERTDAWFKVDWYGVKGWVSADYVETEGTCG